MSEDYEKDGEEGAKERAEMSDTDIIKWILECREEAAAAKKDRMDRNANNYDCFHLRHDFSHKVDGQSTEVLSRQPMAVEQIKSFFQQALADLGDWWSAEAKFPDNEQAALIRPDEITRMTNYQLEKTRYFAHVGNSIESALLGSLAISKCHGTMVPKPRYISRKKGRGKSLKRWVELIDDKTWEIRFSIVRQEDYYPDPTPRKLYEIEEMEIDLFDLEHLSKGDDAIYDPAIIAKIPRSSPASDQETARSRESGQNITGASHRPKVKLTEYWGTILDRDGCVTYENCVATVANDTFLIRKPEPNPLWHQRSPYNASPLMEVANSVWHKAPMDAPTMHSASVTELYNLLVDAAMKQVYSVSQLRKDALDNPAQVSDGIRAGDTLMVNSLLPVGGKVLESLTSTVIPPEALNIMNIMSQEFNSSALTNDLRQGVMPFRAVKATEVVEASQTITSVFQGMAKNYEARQSTPELELAWMTTAQNWDKISKDEFIALFGPQRGEELSQLTPQDVFVSTVNGFKFRVYGVSLTLAKGQDFRKLMQLMQIVWGNPALLEEFSKKYDPGKLLGEVMTSLDIDKYKLEIPKAVQATMEAPPQEPPPQGPDLNSQQPQAGAGSLADMFGGPQLPQEQFPGGPQ